jgi:hypothetical protein
MMHKTLITRNVNARGIPFRRQTQSPVLCSLTMALAFAACGWGQALTFVKGPHRMSHISAAAKAPSGDSGSSHYKFITIATPTSSYAVASGINNSGWVSGYYLDSSSNYHGFVWQGGMLQTVDYPGAVNTILGGINDQGVAIGYYGDGTTNHTVTYAVSNATWSALPDIAGYSQNDGYCINNDGMAVGNAFGSGTSAAWIWDPGTSAYTFFEVPGAAPYTTSPSCINDKNQVAGYYADSSGAYHGFVKAYGSYMTIDVPGAADTFPDGINDWGILQGQIISGSGAAEGFAATPGGVFTLVNYPGSAATAIVGINDHGDICGAYGGVGFSPAMAFVGILQK